MLAVACLLVSTLWAGTASAAQLPVSLGAADGFAVLAGSTVTNADFSTVNGDLGVSPGTAVTGFPPGKVNGTIHAADPVAAAAQGDLTAAYNDAAGRTPPNALPADIGGQTLIPGVYKSGAALGLTGTLTLDGQGDPNAVFVFQIGSALTTAVSSQVNLINGAQAGNVFWQIGSSATLGTSSGFAGTIMALSSISMNDSVTLNGRALARNGAVTLINDTINAPMRPCTDQPDDPPFDSLLECYYQSAGWSAFGPSDAQLRLFHRQAAEIARDALRPQPSIDPSYDPSAPAFDTSKVIGAVSLRASQIAPQAYANAYKDGDAVVIGLTQDVDSTLASLRQQFPSVDIRSFPADYTASQLLGIQREVESLAATDDQIVSVGGGGPDAADRSQADEVQDNTVGVGVKDPKSSTARRLTTRYGDAVSIYQAPELEELADDNSQPIPDRDEPREFLQPGLMIKDKFGHRCTAGFMYYGSHNPQPIKIAEIGTISAGHCFYEPGEDPRTASVEDWYLGSFSRKGLIGPYSRQSLVSPRDHSSFGGGRKDRFTYSDGGTVTAGTENVAAKKVLNSIWVAKGFKAYPVKRQLQANTGAKDDKVCISGAFSGINCGKLADTGPSGVGEMQELRGVRIRGMYLMKLKRACQPGDSGAPVFTRDADGKGATAVGILSFREKANHTHCYMSQIANTELELAVPLITPNNHPNYP